MYIETPRIPQTRHYFISKCLLWCPEFPIRIWNRFVMWWRRRFLWISSLSYWIKLDFLDFKKTLFYLITTYVSDEIHKTSPPSLDRPISNPLGNSGHHNGHYDEKYYPANRAGLGFPYVWDLEIAIDLARISDNTL